MRRRHAKRRNREGRLPDRLAMPPHGLPQDSIERDRREPLGHLRSRLSSGVLVARLTALGVVMSGVSTTLASALYLALETLDPAPPRWPARLLGTVLV
ncbi:MAG: hypothetical protein OEW19_09715, partial [Acidobacteriota bacterium]|nr:hypothetical protein [Acidobacteriota bacterium]